MAKLKEGMMFTATETKKLREKIMTERVIPSVRSRFEKYPALQSAGMFIAQYYNDEAEDAIHIQFKFSVKKKPDFEAAYEVPYDEPDPVNLPDLPNHYDIDNDTTCVCCPWDDNGIVVSAFAAYTKEGDYNEDDSENYTLYAVFKKTADGVKTTYPGKKLRPWVDGMRPEFFGGFDDLDEEQQEQVREDYLQKLDTDAEIWSYDD